MHKTSILRDELVSAYQPYVEKGITNPFDIFGKDALTTKLAELDSAYHEAQSEIAKTLTPTDRVLLEIDQTTVFFDAGFTDVDLLEEIALEWLANVLWDAQDLQDQDLINRVKNKIQEVQSRIVEIDPTYKIADIDDIDT